MGWVASNRGASGSSWVRRVAESSCLEGCELALSYMYQPFQARGVVLEMSNKTLRLLYVIPRGCVSMHPVMKTNLLFTHLLLSKNVETSQINV